MAMLLSIMSMLRLQVILLLILFLLMQQEVVVVLAEVQNVAVERNTVGNAIYHDETAAFLSLMDTALGTTILLARVLLILDLVLQEVLLHHKVTDVHRPSLDTPVVHGI